MWQPQRHVPERRNDWPLFSAGFPSLSPALIGPLSASVYISDMVDHVTRI